MAKVYRPKDEWKKEFLDIFNTLCRTRSSWQVWQDFVYMTAITISNTLTKQDKDNPVWVEREQEYLECAKRFGDDCDKISNLFAITVMALENNPNQDFLGELYMALNLGNHWKGQFFTPYDVCKLMSEMGIGDNKETIEEKGYVSINDCACGAGATLIAAANTLHEHGINYQLHSFFVAQDIDRVVGLMCYIQLSLLGCAGYVVIANSLTNPVVGDVLLPEHKEGQEFWYTPMYCDDVWDMRRKCKMMDSFIRTIA